MADTPQAQGQTSEPTGAQAEPDMNAVLNSINMDDVLQSIGPADVTQGQSQAAGQPAPPISGPDGPLPQPVPSPQEQPSVLHRVADDLSPFDAVESGVTGAAKAAFETKDFVFGEPKPADMSDVRRSIEDRNKELKQESLLNTLVSNGVQWGVAFAGLGKLSKGAQAASRVARWADGAIRAGTTGAVALDPHEGHFSDFVQTHFPSWLQNSVTDYLATKPDDTEAEGRLKNAVESVVYNEAFAQAFTYAAKVVKGLRFGDIKAANAAKTEADTAFTKLAQQEPTAPLPGESQASILPGEGRTADVSVTGSGTNSLAKGPEGSAGSPEASAGARTGASGQGGAGLPDGLPGGPEGNAQGVRNAATGLDAGGGNIAPGQRSGAGGAGPARDNASMGLPPDEGLGLPGSGRTGGDGSVGGGPTPAPPDPVALLNNLKQDNDALIAHGGRDAAVTAGYKFKSGPDYIPWQKLNTDGASQEFMASVLEQGQAQIAAKRGGNAEGVLADKAVNKMIAQRSAVWNEKPEDLKGALMAAGDKAHELAANMETSFLIANKGFQDTYELSNRVLAGNYDGFGSKAEALAAVAKRMETSLEWYANGQALVSNFGRGLRRAAGQFKFTAEQLHNIRTSNPEEIAKFIEQTGGDPKKLAQAGRISLFHQLSDAAAGYRAANLLWGWKTHVVNFAGNAVMLGWRPTETIIGSTLKAGYGKLRGDEEMVANALSLRSQGLKELVYTKSSLMDGWNAAKRAFMEGDSILMPHSTEHTALSQAGQGNLKDIFANGWMPMETMDGVINNAIKTGGMTMAILKGDLRVIGAADEAFKMVRYRAVVQAKAHVEADTLGLTGSKLNDFVSKKLDGAFDDTGRALDKDAFSEAQHATFQNDFVGKDDSWAGPIASGFSNMAAQSPLIRATITPFIKTPTNLFRYGVKLTPGMNLMQREYWNAIKGAKGEAEQVRAIGQMSMGVMAASIAGGLWATGRITGAGPANVQEKKEWLAAGNREYSIAWTNSEGKREFFELNRWDPIGMPLTLVADSLNMLHHANASWSPSDVMTIATIPFLALTKLMSNKTYVKSLADAIDVLTDDQIGSSSKLQAYFKRLAPGYFPAATLFQNFSSDPILREARTTLDGFLSKAPGWAESHLPPRRDIFGDPVIAPQGFTSTAAKSPIDDTLNESFAITGRYLSPPAAKNENTGGVDLRDFTTEDGRSAYDRYQELAGHPLGGAPSLKDALNQLVQQPDFQSLTNGAPGEKGTRSGAIMGVVKGYRQAAFKALLAESPKLNAAVNQRKLDIWRADMVGAKDPKAVAGQARMDNINSLLHTYGLGLPAVTIPNQ